MWNCDRLFVFHASCTTDVLIHYHTAISTKVVPEQSAKVEYDREKFAQAY